MLVEKIFDKSIASHHIWQNLPPSKFCTMQYGGNYDLAHLSITLPPGG